MEELLKKATETAVEETGSSKKVDFDALTAESLLSMPQAAAVLNVSVELVKELIQAGYVPGLNVKASPHQIKYGDLQAYLSAIRVPAASEENESD